MWFYFILAIVIVLLVLFGAFYYISDRVPPVELKGAHVIVTGGSSGIGLEVSKELARRGCHLTIIARNKQKLVEAVEQIEKEMSSEVSPILTKQKIVYFSADVSSSEEMEKVIAEAALLHGGIIDVLINSAGVTKPERFEENVGSSLSWLTSINYLGSAYCTKAVLPFMKKRNRGRIIYVSSIIGVIAFPGYVGYVASKYALRGLAESLQIELSPYNINFSIAIPPNVDTPMYEEEQKIKPPEIKKLEEKLGQSPVSARLVSDDIIKSLSNWRFFIPTGFDAWLVSNAAGCSPASFSELAIQFFISPFVRLGVCLELRKWKVLFKGLHKKI